MARRRVYVTKTGKLLNDDDIAALADEAERGYDVSQLRKRGRPRMGSALAEIVPVRFDPELKRAVEIRAARLETSVSELVRQATREFLTKDDE